MGKGDGKGEGWGEGEGVGYGMGSDWKDGLFSSCDSSPKCKCRLLGLNVSKITKI